MPYTRRGGVEKSPGSFRKWIGLAALVILAVLAISLLVQSFITKEKATKEKVVSQTAPIRLAVAKTQEPADAGSEISGRYVGLCKKESIHSVEDFRKTVLNDPVLSAHFSGFNWKAAKLGKQDKEAWTFVSYRKGESIRRTSKPVRLPKGDGYVTDGVRMVRTYCCNDYVIAPPPMELSMASPENVVERVDGPPRRKNMSAPVDDSLPDLSSDLPAEDPARPILGPLWTVPSYPVSSPFYGGPGLPCPPAPSGGGGPSPKGGPPRDEGLLPHEGPPRHEMPPGDVVPPVDVVVPPPGGGETAPIVTPEPGTFFLMGAGVVLIGLFRLLRRRGGN